MFRYNNIIWHDVISYNVTWYYTVEHNITLYDSIYLLTSCVGTALVCEVSARDGDGIENLIEQLLLQADVMELKAARAGQAEVYYLVSSYFILSYWITSNCVLFYLIYFILWFCYEYLNSSSSQLYCDSLTLPTILLTFRSFLFLIYHFFLLPHYLTSLLHSLFLAIHHHYYFLL